MKKTTAWLARTSTIAAAFALAAAACGGSSDEVTVEGAWARTSPMSANAGAAYFDISSNDANDALIGASVDATIAGEVQVHETSMVEMEDDSMEGMEDDEMEEGAMEGMGDVMQMREVGSIPLPAGETVSLEPGGFHIMMLDLVEPLDMGDTFDLTLDFEVGDDLVISVEVRDGAPE